MLTMMYIWMMILTLMMTMILVLNLTSKKLLIDREKSSPFECGFDPNSTARLPFSLHFFMIAILFLIFDVEITLLFPMIMSIKNTNMIMMSSILTFFIFILITGLIHEWNQGALEWQH